MKTVKYSRQRAAILAFLKTRNDHPTAEVIYNNIRETYPNISLGTVYRNLNLLSKNGDIKKISLEDDSAHFDGFTHPHCHFFCNNCKNVLDIELRPNDMDIINKLATDNFDGEIHTHTSIFYGLCNKCVDDKK